MNRLAATLTRDDVEVDAAEASKQGLFARAGRIFERHHGVGSGGALAETLLARERLGSTALGHGVAIPHGRLRGLKAPTAAIIRLNRGLAFDEPDDEPVILFVFLFVRELADQSDLELLAEIAEMLSDAAVRRQLKSDATAEELCGTIARWTPARPSSRS